MPPDPTQREWTLIADDDDVWSPLEQLPPPLVDPRPPLLNTHEMPWETFERLILAMARALDGAYEAHRYGVPGQAQHGLDVVGFRLGQPPSVYQAKRWEEFGAADLQEAVEKYASGKRPFGADRIVVAVSTIAHDTATIDALGEFKTAYPAMTIELRDRQTISASEEGHHG